MTSSDQPSNPPDLSGEPTAALPPAPAASKVPDLTASIVPAPTVIPDSLDSDLHLKKTAVAETDTEPSLAGTIGRYRIHEMLGEGAFGRVYKATDESLQRQVAIKVLTRSTSVDSEQWLAEARTLASNSRWSSLGRFIWRRLTKLETVRK